MGFKRVESFSSINKYLKCPYSYFYEYVLKNKNKSSDACQRGTEVHDQIESLYKNKDLEDINNNKYNKQLKYASKYLKNHKKNKFVNLANTRETVHELQEACVGLKHNQNDNLIFCEYDDKDAFFRGKIDYFAIFYEKDEEDNIIINKVELIDWKTGKSLGNKLQLKIYAIILMSYLSIKPRDITCKFVYVDQEKETSFTIQEEDINEVVNWLTENIDKIRNENNWLPQQNWTCNYCNIPCIYNPKNNKQELLENSQNNLECLRD
jgi:hypothetical protein